MLKNKIESLQSKNKFILFAGMLGSLQLGLFIIEQLRTHYMKTYFLNFENVGHLGQLMITMAAPLLFLVPLVILAACKWPIQKIFPKVIQIGVILFSITGFVALPFFQLISSPIITPVQYASLFMLAKANWAPYLFCTLANIFTIGPITLFAWGFINQITTKSEALKTYIPLAFCSSLPLIIIRFASTQFKLFSIEPASVIGASFVLSAALSFMLFSLYLFNQIEVDQEESLPEARKLNWKLILQLTFILSALGLAMTYSDILFKNDLRSSMKLAQASYMDFIQQYSIYKTLGTLAVGLFFVRFCKPAISGWTRILTLALSMLLVFSVLAFSVGMSFAGLSYKASIVGIYQICIQSVEAVLIFPFVQIIFVTLPKPVRFITQACIGFLFSGLLQTLAGGFAIGMLVALSGSINALRLPLAALSFIVLSLLFWVALGVSTQNELEAERQAKI